MAAHDASAQERRPASGSSGRDDGLEMYKEAYAEGKRLVDSQQDELSAMRQRAVQFLAFVGSATAFLLGSSLKATSAGSLRNGGFYALAWTASGLTALSLVALVFLLTGLVVENGVRRVHWLFRLNPKKLVADWIEPDLGKKAEAPFYRDLATHTADMAEFNGKYLAQMRIWYQSFLILGILQVSLWVASVWAFA